MLGGVWGPALSGIVGISSWWSAVTARDTVLRLTIEVLQTVMWTVSRGECLNRIGLVWQAV